MSVGANHITAACRAVLGSLALVGMLAASSPTARADGLVASVRRVSTIQSPQELAGPVRPARQEPVHGETSAAEPSSDNYVGGLVPAILFAQGSAQLTPSATRILDNLGASLSAPALAGDRFRVEGHTDTTGSDARNRDLASRRAQAVVDYLEQNCGVAPSRLEAVASAKPLAPTGRGVALSFNRRIRLVNLGK
jgi:outer membrane protein OmpA-like peptidoglycan-associated protein